MNPLIRGICLTTMCPNVLIIRPFRQIQTSLWEFWQIHNPAQSLLFHFDTRLAENEHNISYVSLPFCSMYATILSLFPYFLQHKQLGKPYFMHTDCRISFAERGTFYHPNFILIINSWYLFVPWVVAYFFTRPQMSAPRQTYDNFITYNKTKANGSPGESVFILKRIILYDINYSRSTNEYSGKRESCTGLWHSNTAPIRPIFQTRPIQSLILTFN